MIIRVQCPDGIKRFECQPNDNLDSLFNKLRNSYASPAISLFRERGQKNELKCNHRLTIGKAGLKNGDLLYLEKLSELDLDDLSGIPSTSKGIDATRAFRENEKKGGDNQAQAKGLSSSRTQASFFNLKEDQVDVDLWKCSGLIERPRDPNLCKHGANGKCVNCVPFEPYDENYLKEHNIKHMSFHSYLRKMTTGIDKGKFAAVENISCKIKEGCKGHPPWPNGICTKCQPNAVTLSRQTYRHVDNVVFQNTTIVEQFLNYWRTTSHQRIGFLYGYYETHKDVPLGIKATVVAIYEPPQQSSTDYIRLSLPDENERTVDEIAAGLGLQRVGWIFTDLVSEDLKKGTVKHTRNGDTYFLSAQECMMAAHFQTIHPNPCRLSPDGYFGSKFVTVVVTGDKDNQIHMEGYQVSNQCMALVRDNCLIPTKDAPELAYVKETSKEQYLPDVFFTEKDKFNNEIKQVARLLPIEYLLIDVPVSTPVDQQFSFNSDSTKKSFPIENRMLDGHLQDFHALSSYLEQFSRDEFLVAVNDFHFLIYIATMDMLPMKNVLQPLLNAIRLKDKKLALEWSGREQWATVEQLIASQKPEESLSATKKPNINSSGNIITNNHLHDSPVHMDEDVIISDTTANANSGAGSGGNSSSASSVSSPSPLGTKWSCIYCTFENLNTSASCEICNLPKTV